MTNLKRLRHIKADILNGVNQTPFFMCKLWWKSGIKSVIINVITLTCED